MFSLDSIADTEIITAYEHWQKSEEGYPEIRKSIIDAGIMYMDTEV